MTNPKTMADRASEQSEHMKDTARTKMGEIRDRLGEYYEEGVSRARTLESDLEGAIRRKPVQSILIAAGVAAGIGLLIGYLSARD